MALKIRCLSFGAVVSANLYNVMGFSSDLQEHDHGEESLMIELNIMPTIYIETPLQPKVLDSINALFKHVLGPNEGELLHRILLKLVTKGAGKYVEDPIKQKGRCISKVDNAYEGNSSRLKLPLHYP